MRAVSITFRCKNLKKMKTFYTKILGWDVTDAGSGYCYLDTGGITIGLLAATPDTWEQPTGSSTYLDVEVDDPVTVRSILAVRGVEILKEEVSDAALFIYVRDPDGNIISFFKTGSH